MRLERFARRPVHADCPRPRSHGSGVAAPSEACSAPGEPAEPVILTVSLDSRFLRDINDQASARGRRVVGASSLDAAHDILDDPAVAGVVIDGAMPAGSKGAFREAVGARRPGLRVRHHAPHGSDPGFLNLIDQVAAAAST